jgi:hypothetical protein
MSKDIYKLDLHRHGGPHIDRLRARKNVGRYRLDGTPIPHKGVTPEPIPVADAGRFLAEVAKAQR